MKKDKAAVYYDMGVALQASGDWDEAVRKYKKAVDLQPNLAAAYTNMGVIYRAQGKTEQATETLLLLKTDLAQMEALEARLHALHSYETPEFLVLPIEAGSAGYLAWMQGVLGRQITV